MDVKLFWQDKLFFKGQNTRGHCVQFGYKDERGPSAIELNLLSITGCTAIDFKLIADKMQQQITDFNIETHADQPEKPPLVYLKIHMTFNVWGHNLNEKLIRKAIELTLYKYCPLTITIKDKIPISYDLNLYEVEGNKEENQNND